MVKRRDALRGDRPLPVFVKLSPDLEPQGLDDALEAALAAQIDGVIATNDHIEEGLRSPLRESPAA